MANIPFKSITFPGLPNKYTVPEISSDLMTAGKAADAKATGDALSALEDAVTEETDKLKADLGAVTGNAPISMTPGGYIACNEYTGIDVTSVTANSSYRHAAVPCTSGDVFTVSAKGASSGRAWAFVDGSGNLIQNALASATVSNLVLTAPENAAYLIINDNNTGVVSYRGILVGDALKAIIYTNNLLNLSWKSGSIMTTSGNDNSLTYRIKTPYIAVNASEEYYFDFDDLVNICFVFEYTDSQLYAYTGYKELSVAGVYTVSEGTKYIRIVFGTIDKSAITKDYASNISIRRGDKKYYKDFTFTGASYMTAYGAKSASGWSYTSQIPCKSGQHVSVSGAYSPDYRPILFFDSSDKCVGIYDSGVNSSAMSDFVVVVPDEASYFIVNTNSSAKDDLKIAISNDNTPHDLSYNAWVKISNDTGHKLENIFTNIKSAGPLFTIVDDDGRNLTQVTKFHDTCVASGVVGCNALGTKFIEDMSASDREAFISTLKGYELDGFQNVLHCYDHSYWVSSIDASMSDEERLSVIRRDIVHGMRDMQSFGFVNWKHLIVPQGKTGLYGVEETARNLGFSGAYDVANNSFNHFVNRDNVYHRYSIPRMELYPEDTGHSGLTLQLIKDQADICAEEGGWLIVCTHFYQPGWAANDPTFSRVTEMIEYIMGKGFKNVTLSGGMSYWEDIYRMYGLF